MAGSDGKVFLGLEEISKILHDFRDFDSARISGGEPFEHPALQDIVGLANYNNRRVSILSCGVVQRKEVSVNRMDEIRDYVSDIIFSMHGTDPVHDQIVANDKIYCRHPPYWDMLMDSADNARTAGIPVSFQTVLMKDNLESLEDIAHAVYCFNNFNHPGEYRASWHILRFVKQGRGLDNSDHAVEDKYLGYLARTVARLCKKYHLNISYSDSFGRHRCTAGELKAVVTCYGEVLPCSALKYGCQEGKFACRNRL